MNTTSDEQWHCTNPACRREVSAPLNGRAAGAQMLCVCGSPLKKKYSPPVLTYLEFLQLADTVPSRETSRKG
jgi:hypothetical protein